MPVKIHLTFDNFFRRLKDKNSKKLIQNSKEFIINFYYKKIDYNIPYYIYIYLYIQ